MSGKWFQWQRRAAPYLFVAPFMATFLLFILYPLVQSLILSTYITSGPRSRVFVGLDNYVSLLGDGDFRRAVRNTAIFTLLAVLTQVPVSLGLALLLNSALIRGRNLFRFAFFSPHLFGMVFVALLFEVIFVPEFGLMNRAIHFFFGNSLEWMGLGLDTRWLGRSELVMPAMIIATLWMSMGFNMIYFLAALQSIDRTQYEAAEVDGAGVVQRFVHVTLPGIKPILVFVVVIITIGSFQLYELPYIFFDGTGGPDNAGLTVVMFLYLQGFETGDLGYASAIGWSLAMIVMGVAFAQIIASGVLRRDT